MICVVSMRSMTYAMKAKQALIVAGIGCEITALEAKMTQRGCAYGIKFGCIFDSAVRNVLAKSGIHYSEIITLPS